jgi:hypothetical protein
MKSGFPSDNKSIRVGTTHPFLKQYAGSYAIAIIDLREQPEGAIVRHASGVF